MFTIIVATYNAERCLSSLLDSIVNQKNINFELIIVDGKSTDGTIDIIKKYKRYVTYWISEMDNGIYDAWNKGIAKATFPWIMFLGADDKLLPDSLEIYRKFLNNNLEINGLDFLSSKRQMVDMDGKLIRVTGYCWKWPLFLKFMTVSHPGSLHSKLFFAKYGLFDTTYKIAGDYEILLRPRNELKAFFIDEVTVSMSEGGASDSIAAIKEYFRAATSSGKGKRLLIFFYTINTFLKFIGKKMFRKIGMNLYIRK